LTGKANHGNILATSEVKMKLEKTAIINKLEQITEFCFLGAIASIPFSKALIEIFLTVSFTAWLISKIIKKEPFTTNRTLLIVLVLLVISSSISIFGCGHLSVALHGMVKLLKHILVLLVACDLFRSAERLKRLLLVGTISFSVVAADALFQNIVGYDLIRHFRIRETNTQIRLTGPFNQYGLLAAYLIATVPVFFASLFTYNQKQALECSTHKGTGSEILPVPLCTLKHFAFLTLTVLGFYCLYSTHSRGAWIASFVSLLVLSIIMKKKWILISLIFIALAAPFALPQNAIIHLDGQNKEQSVYERFKLWNRAIYVIKAKPIFGCGINTYTRNHQKYDLEQGKQVQGYYAHNGYLQLAAETGLTSLALFLALIVLSLKSGYAACRQSTGRDQALIAGFFAGLIALLIQACFDTTLHNLQSAVLIWFYIGLLFAFGQMIQLQKTEAR
jgi:putative inorganic carbon (HCO3(-)) transporter